MKKKTGIAGVLALLCTFSISGCSNKEEINSTISTSILPAITTNTTIITTETTTQLTELESEPIVFPTDLSIITAPGHPTYYGSMSQAQEI